MKRLLILFLACFVLVGGAGVGYYAYKANLYKRDVKEVASDLKKQMNVTSTFEFTPPKVQNKTEIVKADGNKKLVPLYLGNSEYYEVEVPAGVEIVTDYATYIYATDMSYKVSVVRGIETNNLIAGLGMSDAKYYNHNIVVTKQGIKAPQEAGTLLYNDVGIIATCYDSPLSYATILNGFEQARVKTTSITDLPVDKSTKVYTSPVEIQSSLSNGTNSLLSEDKSAGAYIYNYDDGYLTEFNATRGVDEFKTDLICRAVLGNADPHLDGVFEGSSQGAKFYYAEIGNITLLCISDTINHTYACFGVGVTARDNIVTYLRNVYLK